MKTKIFIIRLVSRFLSISRKFFLILSGVPGAIYANLKRQKISIHKATSVHSANFQTFFELKN